MGRGPCFVLEQEFQRVFKGRGGVQCRAKSTSNTLLYVSWELSRRAAQASLDPHQIREEQQPWCRGKAQQPQEQQLGGCPPPKQGCLESGAASWGGKQVLEGSAQKVRPRRAGVKLGFCFLSGWLRWMQISGVSLWFWGTSVCMLGAYTVSKTLISCNIYCKL